MPGFATEWYYNLKASNKQPSSCNDFINKLRRFLTYINEDIKTIKPEDITISSTEKYFISVKKKIDEKKQFSIHFQFISIWYMVCIK